MRFSSWSPSLGPRGLLKTSRKGVGEAQLIVHGRASHAGLAPEKGINAIHELAEQITRIEKWNDFAVASRSMLT